MGTMLLIATITGFIFGCTAADVTTSREANTAKQQDPIEEIHAALAGIQTGHEAQDVYKIMAAYSDDFSDLYYAEEPALRAFYEGLASQGALRNTTVDIEECRVVIGVDGATVGPVTYVSPESGVPYAFKMAKGAGGWHIVHAES